MWMIFEGAVVVRVGWVWRVSGHAVFLVRGLNEGEGCVLLDAVCYGSGSASPLEEGRGG